MSLLTVDNLKTYFHTRNGVVKAVDGISYTLKKGETLGIVGESGSGKSVSCYSIMQLLPMPPGRIESGTAMFDGIDLVNCTPEQIQKIRGNRISMIFQDPMTCLNPYLTVGFQLMEPLLIHKNVTQVEARRKVMQALQEVGIQDAENRFDQYPHEFSGGMRQRVMIAMALITEPELLIADEPTTALDVTIQAQILDLIKRLQRDHGTAVIFITHDLGVIASMADKLLVMYAGKVVEQGTTKDIYYNPEHPYTKALLESIPGTHEPGEQLYTIEGLPPDVSKPIPGCAFAPRCEFSDDSKGCSSIVPELKLRDGTHFSACTRVQKGEIDVKLHQKEKV